MIGRVFLSPQRGLKPRTMLLLDHLFVFTPPGAPESALLQSRGFVVSIRRDHPGQGTANCCFSFQNGYVELLYPTDEALLRSPPVLRTRLWERSRWRESGTSPFGICLRGQAPLPVSTWPYHAPFLAPGSSIPVAEDADGSAAPLLFFRADLAPTTSAAVTPNPQQITRVMIESPTMPTWLDAISRATPVIELIKSPRHSMLIELDNGQSGQELFLGKLVPVTLRW